jgi:ABC transporter, substrate-binding protein
MPVTERFPPTLKGHFDQSCVKKPAVWTTSPYSGFSYFLQQNKKLEEKSMNTKRIVSLVASLALVLSMSLGLSGCGDKAAQDNNQGSTDGESTKYTVGICQLVQHEALDAATQGFIDALNEALPGEVEFQTKNASGDSANCSTIVNGFVSDKVDLIMANATGALTAAAAATSDIPILGTSITAYGVALDIDDFDGTVGGNISGTSDLADLEAQANMITEWFPEAQKVALLFCSAEPNSRYQIEEVAKCLSDKGIETKEFAFTDTNDVASVTQSAADYADVVYVPTDNTAASNTEAIANILVPAGVPAICGEEGICKGCGVATLSINYYDLGVTTGKMAAKILTGEANISEMPIEFTEATPKYNPTMCETLGIEPLDGYTAIED